MRRGPTRHHFVRADPPDVDPVTQVEWCADPPLGCGLPAGNAIHNMPEILAEQRKHEARRVGERVDDD